MAVVITQLPELCIAAIVHLSQVDTSLILGSAGRAGAFGGFDPASGFGLDCAGPLFPSQL